MFYIALRALLSTTAKSAISGSSVVDSWLILLALCALSSATSATSGSSVVVSWLILLALCALSSATSATSGSSVVVSFFVLYRASRSLLCHFCDLWFVSRAQLFVLYRASRSSLYYCHFCDLRFVSRGQLVEPSRGRFVALSILPLPRRPPSRHIALVRLIDKFALRALSRRRLGVSLPRPTVSSPRPPPVRPGAAVGRASLALRPAPACATHLEGRPLGDFAACRRPARRGSSRRRPWAAAFSLNSIWRRGSSRRMPAASPSAMSFQAPSIAPA